MPGEGTESSTAQESTGLVPNQLAILVPTFDPSKDDLTDYTKKVQLLQAMWPEGKWTELATRLILGCTGSAFQKLQLNAEKITKNERASIQRLIELLGGQWGQIPLERKYEYAERALFRSSQRSDETNDSYLARCDVAWSELLSRQVTLSELQAYIVLRGSNLGSEDKKRVVIESESAADGKLTVEKVTSAIRMLGAGFFQEMVSGKRTGKLKTYDSNTMFAEDQDESTFAAEGTDDLPGEEDLMDVLIQEGDDDALLIADFEATAMDLVQSDEELASALTAYTDARRRLSDKMKSRGFWPPRKGKGKGSGHKGGKGKFHKGHPSSRKSLQSRIMESRCRICDQYGHWKAECPRRNDPTVNPHAGTSANRPGTAPTSFVQVSQEHHDTDALTLEFLELPDAAGTALDATQLECPCFMVIPNIHDDNHSARFRLAQTMKRIQTTDPKAVATVRNRELIPAIRQSLHCRAQRSHSPAQPLSDDTAVTCFATHGSLGVVDLGATKTVIGSNQVREFLDNMDEGIRSRITKCPCKITFRFGNQGTLQSQYAMVVPIHGLNLKIAIVPGSTPFLLSNTLLRALGAMIDTEDHLLISKKFKFTVPLQLTRKGLFLLDLNDLARTTAEPNISPSQVEETHLTIHQNHQPMFESQKSNCQPQPDAVAWSQQRRFTQVHRFRPKSHRQLRPWPKRWSNHSNPGPKSPAIATFVTSNMSDLVARLQRMQMPIVDTVSQIDLNSYSLDQLENMKITFGKQQIGKKFATVWKNEQRWVTWFLQHYQSSKKPEHMLFIRYAELKLERAEMEDTKIPVLPSENPPKITYVTQVYPKSYGVPKSKAAAKAQSAPSEPWIQADEESNFELLPDLEDVVTQEQPDLIDPQIIHLEQRLYQMENALSRVVHFIENQTNNQVNSQWVRIVQNVQV